MEKLESIVHHHNLVKLNCKAKVLNQTQNKQACLAGIFRPKND